ncbi:ribosome maturation factor RimP [Acidithiobacillus thiooxidans]|jgi:ribosome maturation factor RimP|nr:ribosome maturation factor RimP [Acidithiobacillus albertensis]MBU2835291.1 ribosome maturation factor RimP [Acidithiobacillus thiooxidans]MBU2839528.1 ribosome maturation factor RimP [Acidithiobacillus thiooxidans]
MMNVEERLDQEIARQVGTVGCALVDARMLRSGRAITLQILIEKEDGASVTIEDCATVSRQLSVWLDVANPINGAYRLEVSSAGLDRPLKTLQDYERFQGEHAEVHLYGLHQGRRRLLGVLQGLEDQKVVIENSEGRWTLALDEIHKAKLVPQW